MDRLFAMARINNLLQDYTKNDFNPLDKKLIRGIFKRKTEIVDFMQRKDVEIVDTELEQKSDDEAIRSKNNLSEGKMLGKRENQR